MEKVPSPPKDEDDSSSDLSNDTPLSELIKQETTAKAELQQKTAAAAAAVAAAEAAAAEAAEAAEAKIDKEEPDTFESDSNDDKCLGSIKREIQSLSAQKESSEDSSETPAETMAITLVDEKEEEKIEDVVEVEPAAMKVDEEEPQ